MLITLDCLDPTLLDHVSKYLEEIYSTKVFRYPPKEVGNSQETVWLSELLKSKNLSDPVTNVLEVMGYYFVVSEAIKYSDSDPEKPVFITPSFLITMYSRLTHIGSPLTDLINYIGEEDTDKMKEDKRILIQTEYRVGIMEEWRFVRIQTQAIRNLAGHGFILIDGRLTINEIGKAIASRIGI